WRGRDTLQRHAALWTAARSALADLRVHRARVDGVVRRRRRSRRWRRTRVTLRIGDELFAAARAAKPVRRAGVLGAAAGRISRISTRAADRILASRSTGLLVMWLAVGHGPFPLSYRRTSRPVSSTYPYSYPPIRDFAASASMQNGPRTTQCPDQAAVISQRHR